MPKIYQFDFKNISPYKTRKTLIERCKANDPEAWLAFYRPYYNYARNVIKSSYFNIPESDIDELAHQIMIDMCEKIGNFDPETPSRYHPGEKVTFRGWFGWQVKTVVRNYFRKNKHIAVTEEFKPELNTALADFADAFCEEREQAIQAKAMELLLQSRSSKRNIEAFQMYLNGIGVVQIAQELDMPQNSVHQAICRCRKFLTERRKELEELI